jgi:hypothetical protein
MTAKITKSLLIAVLISVALLNSGTQLSLWLGWTFVVLLAVHFVECLVKRHVMQAAGGSILNHFLQTMLFGIIHWRPLARGG